MTHHRIVLVLLLGLLIGAMPAEAQRINLHGLSQHYGPEEFDYNDENWGIGYEHGVMERDLIELALGGGVFRNSFRNTSVYVSGVATIPPDWPVRVGIIGLMVTGYDGTHRDPDGNEINLGFAHTVTPIVMPGISIGYTVQFRAAVLPATNGFVTGQLSVDVGDLW